MNYHNFFSVLMIGISVVGIRPSIEDECTKHDLYHFKNMGSCIKKEVSK